MSNTTDTTEEKTTTITMSRLAELLKAEAWRNAVESGGIDSWDWLGASLEDAEYSNFCDQTDAAAEAGTLTPGD